jgi:3',5'-cyclic AMP phosphodiesterase CpdA
MAFHSALIHLSDTEFGPNNRSHSRSRHADHNVCGEMLVDDITRLMDEREVPKNKLGLVITGDIAHSGEPQQYSEALRSLSYIRDKLGIAKERVALVPGNHDVSWADCKSAALDIGIDVANKDDRLCARLLPEKLRLS